MANNILCAIYFGIMLLCVIRPRVVSSEVSDATD